MVSLIGLFASGFVCSRDRAPIYKVLPAELSLRHLFCLFVIWHWLVAKLEATLQRVIEAVSTLIEWIPRPVPSRGLSPVMTPEP